MTKIQLSKTFECLYDFRHRIYVSSIFFGIVLVGSPRWEYTLLILSLTLFYTKINQIITRSYPHKLKLESINNNNNSNNSPKIEEIPAFRLYVPLLHLGPIISLCLLSTLILRLSSELTDNDRFGLSLSDWFTSSWGEHQHQHDGDSKEVGVSSLSPAEYVDVFTICLTIAFEIKDGLIDDFDRTIPRMGIFVHHVLTAFGCLFALRLEFGKGFVVLNTIQALLGSFVYVVWRLGYVSTVYYMVVMTLSNVLALYIAFRYRELALEVGGGGVVFYVLLCSLLTLLRQQPVLQLLMKRRKMVGKEL